jgi:hypothetical protein
MSAIASWLGIAPECWIFPWLMERVQWLPDFLAQDAPLRLRRRNSLRIRRRTRSDEQTYIIPSLALSA